MTIPAAVSAAFASLIAYVWFAAYVWHILPEPNKQWWTFPALLTTIFLGVGILIGTLAAVIWYMDDYRRA